ncbi:MAG: heme o synthase [Actinomycetota bacterium]|nr:heme o synthase [Actinomycetota bacterium]
MQNVLELKTFIKKAKNTFSNYLEISKPRSVILLYFTALSSMLIASSIYSLSWLKIIFLSMAIILGVMGANATTNYIDRKIDSEMERTKSRAIASGKINPAVKGLVYALILVLAAIAIALYVNWLSALFLFFGFFNSAILYNGLTKQRTRYNILIGSPSGGFPVLVAYAGISGGKIDLIAVIMFIFVIIWTPSHIWSLAYFYKEDYKKAAIPMLPVFLSEKQNHLLLAILNILMVLISVLLWHFYKLSYYFFGVVGMLGIAIIIVSVMMLCLKGKKLAWILFKLSSPYLGIVFLMLTLEFIFKR